MTLSSQGLSQPGIIKKRSALPAVLAGSTLCALLLRHFIIAIYVIEGSSMSPTLHDGDTALVNRMAPHLGDFQRGEIVLIQDGFRDLATKRIVGLPGERIDICANHVFINGRLLKEGYLAWHTRTVSPCPSFQLRKDEYFVLGDNRADSYDSRFYGPVAKKRVVGSYSRTFWACR